MRRRREAQAQPIGRVPQVPAAAGKGFARDARPHRARPGLDLQGGRRAVLRFTRGRGLGAHGEDAGVDEMRLSQVQ